MVESVFLKSNRVATSRPAWSTAFLTSCMSTSETTSKVGMGRSYRERSQGSVPEWPKGADCKSAGTAFGGSNPPRPTSERNKPLAGCLRGGEQWASVATVPHGGSGGKHGRSYRRRYRRFANGGHRR